MPTNYDKSTGQYVEAPANGRPGPPGQPSANIEYAKGEVLRERLWRKGQQEQHDLWFDWQSAQSKTFQDTLKNAARTYKALTAMAVTMFVVGLALFVWSAVYATLPGNTKIYAVLFAGMGAGTFAALFLLEPFTKGQSALSNLMQAEVCFMTTFAQTRIWLEYPYDYESGRVDPTRQKDASDALDRLARHSMSLLEKYLEPPLKDSEEKALLKKLLATSPETAEKNANDRTNSAAGG
jgi:hypothetical protein